LNVLEYMFSLLSSHGITLIFCQLEDEEENKNNGTMMDSYIISWETYHHAKSSELSISDLWQGKRYIQIRLISHSGDVSRPYHALNGSMIIRIDMAQFFMVPYFFPSLIEIQWSNCWKFCKNPFWEGFCPSFPPPSPKALTGSKTSKTLQLKRPSLGVCEYYFFESVAFPWPLM